MGTTLAWLKREVILWKNKNLNQTVDEGMLDLIKAIEKSKPPTGDA